MMIKGMDSIGVYWIPLKPGMLPFVVMEVDKVIEKFFREFTRAEAAGQSEFGSDKNV